MTLAEDKCKKLKHQRHYARKRHLVKNLATQNCLCFYCDRKLIVKSDVRHHPNYATVDHLIPLSKGGSNKRDNIVIACFDCNQRKGDKILDFGEIFECWSRIRKSQIVDIVV